MNVLVLVPLFLSLVVPVCGCMPQKDGAARSDKSTNSGAIQQRKTRDPTTQSGSKEVDEESKKSKAHDSSTTSKSPTVREFQVAGAYAGSLNCFELYVPGKKAEFDEAVDHSYAKPVEACDTSIYNLACLPTAPAEAAGVAQRGWVMWWRSESGKCKSPTAKKFTDKKLAMQYFGEIVEKYGSEEESSFDD